MRINISEFNQDKQQNFLFVGNNEKFNNAAKTEERKEKKNGNHIYGGDINRNMNLTEKIDKKREQAQQQAIKLISEAYNKDLASEVNIDKLRELHAEKVSTIAGENEKIMEFESQKEELREQYGVTEDSQEQKDLELLQRYQNSMSGVESGNFSEEDINRLKELQNIPRTEYQDRVLEINQAEGVAKKKVKEAQSALKPISDSIYNSKQEQLKSKTMLNAQKSVEELIDAAEKEIFGMLVQDAKDNIDKDIEEEKEKAEEAADEKAEKEERIEEQKQERKEQEELLTQAVESNKAKQEMAAVQGVPNSVVDAQNQIQEIIVKNNLNDEDLKGIEIDLNY